MRADARNMLHNRFMARIIEQLVDYVLNFFVAYTVYLIFHIAYKPLEPFDRTVMVPLGALCLAASFTYEHHNVYAPMRGKKAGYFVGRILWSNFEISVLMLIIMALVGDRTDPFYRMWAIVAAAVSSVILIAKKLCMITVLRSLRSNRKSIRHILLVTDSREITDEYMEEILENPQFGYSVIGYVGNQNVIGLPHLGTTEELDRILSDRRPDEVVMAFETVRRRIITRYIDLCNDHCIKVMLVPSVCGYFKSPKQVTTVGNLPLIDVRSNPLDNPANRFLKRTLDIVCSAILIAVTSPLMIFTAIGVRISSPGPIFFRQTRVGKNNREFTMYKFRSMRVNDSQQTGWSTENDPRKTRFGAFIRKFALDELPQLFNVLFGDMSLVGPRPEVPFYVEKFKKEIPLYMLKHSVRPGITGLAQIKGLRGDTSIQARIDEDINYIENWSIWEDLRILILTPFCAINRHEKYAEQEEKAKNKPAPIIRRFGIMKVDSAQSTEEGGATVDEQNRNETDA